MAHDEDIAESVERCLEIIEENMEILTDLKHDLDDQKNDELDPDIGLHGLYDMVEDVAQSAKLKRAESNFNERQSQG